MSEHDNLCRWSNQPGHYEVWYLTGNHRQSQTGYWIRYTFDAPFPGSGDPYAQLWFALFDARDPGRNVAINQKLPIATLQTQSDPFSLTLGEAHFTHGSARGSLRGAGHEASWDLSWTPSSVAHRHLPAIMYRRGGLGETTVLSPSLNIALSGTITCDDRRIELTDEPFGQTHLWGKKHAYSWAWGHCTAFDDHPDAAFEILSIRLKRRGVVLPQMTIFTLYLDGQAHRFTEFYDLLRTRGQYGTARFSFAARGLRTRIEGEFTCRPEDMVVATYHDPDGELSYCANTEVADLRIAVYERNGVARWRERQQLRATHRGHFEVAHRERDPAIRADHLTI